MDPIEKHLIERNRADTLKRAGIDHMTADYEAAMSMVPDENGWLSIESAPVNTAILIHLRGTDYYGNDGIYEGMLVDMGTGKRWMTVGWAIGRDIGADNQPTAWQPLPKPPVSP